MKSQGFFSRLKTWQKILLAVVLGLVLAGLAVAVTMIVWLNAMLQPADDSATQEVSFSIPKGQAVVVIGNRLEEQGLIKNTLAFRYVIWKNGLQNRIQAGNYTLRGDWTPLQIAQSMTKGSEDQRVTIREGLRKEEIAELFTDFSKFDPDEFLQYAEEDEGMLFPDTYSFPITVNAKTVYNTLTQRFEDVVEDNDIESKAKPHNLTLNQVVTLASLLEREAQSAEDMQMVAGIIYNRMRIGQPLQIDATMQYVKGFDKKTGEWWNPALSADKQLNSPYNTYLVSGLPPGPIANPGLKALKAAVDPTDSEFFYYITDNQGNMHYSKDYDTHLENIRKHL